MHQLRLGADYFEHCSRLCGGCDDEEGGEKRIVAVCRSHPYGNYTLEEIRKKKLVE